jgi:hypothetical protein
MRRVHATIALAASTCPQERLDKVGSESMPMSSDELAKYFRDDVLSTAKLMQQVGVKPSDCAASRAGLTRRSSNFHRKVKLGNAPEDGAKALSRGALSRDRGNRSGAGPRCRAGARSIAP